MMHEQNLQGNTLLRLLSFASM